MISAQYPETAGTLACFVAGAVRPHREVRAYERRLAERAPALRGPA